MAECWKLNPCKTDFMLVERGPEEELACTKTSSLCLCTTGHFTSVFGSGFLTVAKHSYRAESVRNTIPYWYLNLEDCPTVTKQCVLSCLYLIICKEPMQYIWTGKYRHLGNYFKNLQVPAQDIYCKRLRPSFALVSHKVENQDLWISIFYICKDCFALEGKIVSSLISIL